MPLYDSSMREQVIEVSLRLLRLLMGRWIAKGNENLFFGEIKLDLNKMIVQKVKKNKWKIVVIK